MRRVKKCKSASHPGPKGIVPKRAQVGHYEKVAMFMDYAERVSSTTARIGSYDDLPGAITQYLREHNLPQAIVMEKTPRLKAVNWPHRTTA